jgi:hypothetical protein
MCFYKHWPVQWVPTASSEKFLTPALPLDPVEWESTLVTKEVPRPRTPLSGQQQALFTQHLCPLLLQPSVCTVGPFLPESGLPSTWSPSSPFAIFVTPLAEACCELEDAIRNVLANR